MRRLLSCLVITASLALTACGSTVQQSDTSLQGQGGLAAPGQDPGAALGTPGSLDAPAGGTGGLPTDTTGGTGGTSGNGGLPAGGTGGTGGNGGATTPSDPNSTGGNGGGNGGGSGGGGGAPGRGVTADSISIGIPVETGTQAAADAFGVSGASTASQEAIYKAVLSDVNKSGGVLGRKLTPAFHPFDVGAAVANPNQTVAEICADYATDRPVLAVVFGIANAGLRECTAKMGSPLLLTNSTASVVGQAEYAKNGGNFLYGVNSITAERQADLFVDSLLDRKFDATWNTATGGPGALPVKMAVIHVDTPEQNALYAAYEKALKARGYSFAEKVTYPQNATSALASTQSAVLRFRGAGITHVFGASVFYLLAAEAQGYRPRYAYIPGLGQLGVSNAPARQMNGAMTVGWAPTTDVGAAKDPGANPGAARCMAAMKAGGLSTGKRGDLPAMYNACDVVYSMVAALKAGGSPNVAGLRAGFESMGSSFKPALTFRTSLSPSSHSGINSVRDMAYDSGCKCLVYTSNKDRS